ncbi:putative NBD/HSP70 family sugar kinase [Anaerobacterium chartisolvens]|uniref:Putative NBD/HSP70 family sugar kinase n=1 Tax=Anaerobacterium chartisolvens TaxID=1297424 RepID=A0A369BEX1_9FIRM|nr:ROK family protein [Anaerobacterium chartisolvens]RCX20093.1 putative NBD/HSP70 family sugar kinase [Anaerobacterium chartisolvens]
MAKAGINLENVRIKNRVSILRTLNANGAMPRKDIAAILELTPAAVTILCHELIEEGIIIEKGEVEEEKRAGRKKLLIDINRNYKYIIGINIEPDFTYLSIADLKGDSILSKKIDTDNTVSPGSYLRMINNNCIRMLWEADIQKNDILGIGVGIIGSVDRDNGISRAAYDIWQEEVPVKEIIEKELLLPVFIDNNVRAFALGEIVYGRSRDVDNMLFMKWGPGVGSAVVINKEIYVGENFKSSSLGHFIVDRNGSLCRCGRRGCIETIASKGAVYKAIKEIVSKENAVELLERLSGNIQNLNVDNVFDYIDSSDEPIQRYINGIIENLAIILSNAVTLLSPRRVLLFGKAFENKEIYNRFVENYKLINNGSYKEDFIVTSSIMQKLNYIGPVAIVANKMLFNETVK